MSKALKQIESSTKDYTINFIYNELEDFTVTTSVKNRSVPDAIRDVIGFYPIRMTVDGKNIFVECVQKETTKLIGRLIDKSGQPVMYANIALLSPRDSSYITGGVSNEAGQFAIPCASKNILARISCIGYRTSFRSLQVGNVGKIIISSDVISLQQVTIKGHRQLVSQKDGALVTEVAGSLLSKCTNTDELLSKIPGMVKTPNGGLEVFGSGTPIIYINKRKMNNKAELSSISPKDIKNIELITNPGAKYDASGQAVLIIHTLDKDDGYMFQASTSLNAGFYPTYNYNIDGGYKKGGLNMLIHYDYFHQKQRVNQPVLQELHSDSILYRYDRQQYDIRKASGHSWQTNVEYVFNSKHTAGLEYDGNHSNGNQYRKSFLNYFEDGTMKKQLDIDIRSPHDLGDYDHLNVYHNAKWSDKFSSDLNLDYVYSHSTVQQTNDAMNIDTKDVNRVTNHSNSNYNIYSGQLNFDFKPSKPLSLSWGIVGSSVRSNAGNYYDRNVVSSSTYHQKEDKIALYAEARLSLGNFSLKGGLRYENMASDYIDNVNSDNNIHRTYSDLFPSLSLSNNCGDWSNTLSYTSLISRPSFTQLSDCSYYATEYLYQQGNPLLKPVNRYSLQWTTNYKILTFFLRYQYKKNYIDNGWFTPDNRPNVIISSYMNYKKAQDIVSGLILSKNTSWWLGSLQLLIDKPIFSAYYLGEKIKYNSPQITFTADNTFQLPHAWVINPYFMYCNGGNRATIKFKPYWDAALSVKKSFFDERLTFAIEASDIFHQMKYREEESVGRLYFNQMEYYNEWFCGLTITFRFNKKSHEYQGKNSAQDEINRL
jgi:hypothetical protein